MKNNKNIINNFFNKIENKKTINVYDVLYLKKIFKNIHKEDLEYIQTKVEYLEQEPNFKNHKTYLELNAIIELISEDNKLQNDSPIYKIIDKYNDRFSNFIQSSKIGFKAFRLNTQNSLKIEFNETIEMFKYLKSKDKTDEEKKEAISQVKDIGKIVVVASTPAIVLPLFEYSIKKVTRNTESTILPTSFKPNIKKLEKNIEDFNRFETRWNPKIQNQTLTKNEFNKMLIEHEVISINFKYAIGKDKFKERFNDTLLDLKIIKSFHKEFKRENMCLKNDKPYENISL